MLARLFLLLPLALLTLSLQAQKVETIQTKASKNKEAMAHFNEGQQAFDAGKYGQAAKSFRAATLADPGFVDAYDNLGLAFLEKGKLDSAEFYTNWSIKLDPKGTAARQNLALIHFQQGKLESSLSEYQELQALAPKDAEGYYGAAEALLALDRYGEAKTQAQKAIDIYKAEDSPFLFDAHLLKGMAHYLDGENDAAREHLDAATRNGRTVPNWILKELGLEPAR